jgi:hypothetical protein
MSLSLSAVQQKIFDAMVKQAFQSKGWLLRECARTRENVEGTQVQFRKMGELIAQQYAFQSQVNYQDPNFQPVEVTLNPWRVATLLDDVERFLVNFDERKEDAEAIAMAIGRRSDQLLINALDASGTSNIIATGGTGLTFQKIRAVAKFFDDNAVPPEERYIAISAKGQEDLFADDQFTSNFYTNLHSITTGSLNNVFTMGMKWKIIPTMVEGGLPLNGNIRTAFAWQKTAMGQAYGKYFNTQIERVPEYDSWQILGKIFANAVCIDNVGVIDVNYDESIIIP